MGRVEDAWKRFDGKGTEKGKEKMGPHLASLVRGIFSYF
jgi:hypothetical protein